MARLRIAHHRIAAPAPPPGTAERVEDKIMKLASYIANGKPSFGVVTGDGVVTMNDKLGGRYATLRDAIAGGAIDEMKRLANGAAPDQKLAGLTLPAAHSEPGKNPLRRHQLQVPRRRARHRGAEAAEHLHPIRQHAGCA